MSFCAPVTIDVSVFIFALLHAAATEKHDLALVGIVATEGVCELRVCLAFVVRIVVQLRSPCVSAKIRLENDVKRLASHSITMSSHIVRCRDMIGLSSSTLLQRTVLGRSILSQIIAQTLCGCVILYKPDRSINAEEASSAVSSLSGQQPLILFKNSFKVGNSLVGLRQG